MRSILPFVIWTITTVSAINFEETGETDDDSIVETLIQDLVKERTSSGRAFDCGVEHIDLRLGQTGTITSPNYPSNYSPSSKCIYWLKSEPQTRIHLHCDDIQTQPCNPKFYDFVLLSPDWDWKSFKMVCGTTNVKLPIDLYSTKTEAAIYLRTSLKDNYKGFRCIFRVIPAFNPTPSPTSRTTTVRSTVQKVEDSGPQFNGDSNVCGLSPIAKKSHEKDDNNRIVGGVVATPHEFPWLVGISMNGTWFCGGTLISDRWVLTAAHCTHQATFGKMFLGSHHLQKQEKGRVVKDVTKFFKHPAYLKSGVTDDIALIELPEPVEFTDKIRPVCLPRLRDSADTFVGTEMMAAGWGKITGTGPISEVLMKLSVKVITLHECASVYGNIVNDKNMCTRGILTGSGTCQGDSGSSLMYQVEDGRWVQAGVVSFGSAMGCSATSPSGYAKVASYLEWIGQVTGLNLD